MSWDINSKLLLKECPQDFVSYFVPGARYVGMRETQFQTNIDGPYDAREIRGDCLVEVELAGTHFLIGIELQSTRDAKMDERLLGYSYEATRQHQMLVLSCVIYMKKVKDAPQPPLDRTLPNHFRTIWFNYKSVELAEQRVEELRQYNLDGLWPLMLLCKDGSTYDMLENVLAYLKSKKQGNLLWITAFYANMVFTSAEDKVHLQRRFAMLDEFLWENSWVYRDTVQKGVVQGLEQGRQQGVAQGLEQGRQQGVAQGLEQGVTQGHVAEARANVEAVVKARFSDLLPSVERRLEFMDDLARLRELLLLVSTAHDADEVKRSWPELH